MTTVEGMTRKTFSSKALICWSVVPDQALHGFNRRVAVHALI